MYNNPILMVVAGSRWQIPLVLKIKSMGFRVLVINPLEDSPAFDYADHYELIDIRDLDRCLDAAVKYNVAAVCSDQSDIAVLTVAYIAEKMSLTGLNYEMSQQCTNKFLMREHCARMGYPSTKYEYCDTPQKLQNFFHNSAGKIIVKPLNSNSSRGVIIADDESLLAPAFNKAIDYTYGDSAVLAEEYIEGPEFTVDGIVIQGRHFSLATSIKKHYKHNPNIAYELFFSYSSNVFNYEKLRGLNNSILESLYLPDGTLTHSEYKFSEGTFRLIEYAARGGGNLLSSSIVPYLSGFDNYSYHIGSRVQSAIPSQIPTIDQYSSRCAVLRFLDLDIEGTVREIQGADFLDDAPEIIQYRFNFAVGDRIKKPDSDALRFGFYIAVAENEEALKHIMYKVEEEILIKVEA